MTVPDQELIQQARQGDNEAFGKLWARYERQVAALCRRYLDSPHRDPALDANDLSNETFIRVLHNLDRYQDYSQEGRGFETWLLEIAKRLCLKALARQRRRRQWLSDSPDAVLTDSPDCTLPPARLAEQREILRLAAQEINALPEIHRLPFKLFMEEYSHREIAEALGISVDNAMLRVHRARKRLQARLAELHGITLPTRERVRRYSRYVEQELSEIVSESRIVTVPLSSGGELQICLRVDRGLLRQEADIADRRSYLHLHPRAWRQRLDFADLCYQGGKWEEAREGYRGVLAVRPGCSAASLRLGRMLQQEQRLSEAGQVYHSALQQAPSPEIAAQLQAEYALATGESAQAMEAFRAAIALLPQEKASYYGLHIALGRLSRYADQLENLSALRAIDPRDIFAYDEAYTPCARMLRWDLALPLLKRAVEIDPNHPVALKHLFQVRMNLDLWNEETLALAERLVRLAPEFVESWSELAWIYAEMGRPEESLGVLQKFLADHPANAEAYAALAWRYYYLNRYEEQVAHALQAYRLSPENPHICWTMLIACNRHTESLSQTEIDQIAEEIARCFSHDVFLLEKLCELAMTREKEAEAQGYALQIRDLQPLSVPAKFWLPTVYTHFHHWQEAANEYRHLLLLPEGRTVDTLISLGMVLTLLRDPDAEAVIGEAMPLAQSPEEHLILAERCFRYKQFEYAAFAMQRYSSLPCDSPRLEKRAQILRGLLSLQPPTES